MLALDTTFASFDKFYHQYDALIGDRRAGVEAPSCEKGVHVRTYRCTPHLTSANLLSNGSLAAHQVQTQSAQQFARYGKRVCACARADATHPDLCKARIYWAPSHTQNLNAILPAVCEIWKSTCARADALHLRHVESTYLMGPWSHTTFERNPPSRLRDLENGCARAHVQMHSTSDM